MKKSSLRVIKQLFPVYLSVIAAVFSVSVFLTEFKSNSGFDIVVGTSGAIIGILVAYMLVKIKEATAAPSLFISYSHKDKEFVDKLYNELRKTPYDIIFYRQEIKVSDDIKTKVTELLSDSDYVIFVGSTNTSSSKWVSSELANAKELNKKILPLVIDDARPNSEIEGLMYADFTNSFEDGMNQLIRALKTQRHNKKIKAQQSIISPLIWGVRR